MLPAGTLAQADWAAEVVALAPALRACLQGAAPGAFAADVAPDGPGGLRITVRVDSSSSACSLRDGRVVARTPLPGAAPPDPAAPAFFLDRRCVDARRVDAPDGTVLGWMAYPAC